MVRKLIVPALLSAIIPFLVLARINSDGGPASAIVRNRSGEQVLPADQSVNAVIQWNRTLLAIVRTPGAQPPTIHATRSFAILHAAIYDAVNSILNTHKPYMIHLAGVAADTSTDAAASAAAHDVLVQLYPGSQAMLDAQLQASLGQVPDGAPKSTGIQVGQTVAGQMLVLRANDGSTAQPVPFMPGTEPGDYQSTPPNFPKAAFTAWSSVTPFALNHADQFRPGPPPVLTSNAYAKAFNEVKELGEDTSATRTAVMAA